MILGFQTKFPWGTETNFKKKILEKKKKHTLRIDQHERWKKGNSIQFATGARTKRYHQFEEGECKSTQKIEILEVDYRTDRSYTYTEEIRGVVFWKSFIVKIDGNTLGITQIAVLAHNDGFETTDDFFRWFIDGFSGKIIHWTDFKY